MTGFIKNMLDGDASAKGDVRYQTLDVANAERIDELEKRVEELEKIVDPDYKETDLV